jgi:hypothetical protein
MTEQDIEHMWKVASNNPNHDTNWHDPVVVAFARAIERQIGFDKAELWIKRINKAVAEEREAVLAEREACAKVCEEKYEYYGHDHVFATAIRARGQAS